MRSIPKLSFEDSELIKQITIRAQFIYGEAGREVPEFVSLSTKIALTHGLVPMRLEELLNAPAIYFMNDIDGIMKNFTAFPRVELKNGWFPRYALMRAFL